MLRYSPFDRISAAAALAHEYFADFEVDLNIVECAEYDVKDEEYV